MRARPPPLPTLGARGGAPGAGSEDALVPGVGRGDAVEALLGRPIFKVQSGKMGPATGRIGL